MPLGITHYPRANWLLTPGEWMHAQASPQLTPLCTAAAVGALTVRASKWYGGKGIDGSERTSSRAGATSPKQQSSEDRRDLSRGPGSSRGTKAHDGGGGGGDGRARP